MKPSGNLIFVSIASYRDPQTQTTIESLINQAKYPENIRIGVVEQNLPSDNFKCKPVKNKVKVLRLREGIGPAAARFLASTLWKGETFYLQIDSHMKFVKYWDVIITEDLNNCDGNRCVLTCYPPPELTSKPVSSITENWKWDPHNHIIAQGKIQHVKEKPCLGIFVSAGFLFFRAEPFLTEISYDPNLYYLFQGEEILLSARLFTKGWLIYHPSMCVCSHDYLRHDQPKVWQNNAAFWAHNAVAVRKYRYLTHQLKCGDPPPTTYGLGTVRSVEKWKEMIGLDPEIRFD